MKIVITMDVDEDYADPEHDMGVTEEGYMMISDALSDLGTDIDVQRADPARE